jgi:hypothetical protein
MGILKVKINNHLEVKFKYKLNFEEYFYVEELLVGHTHFSNVEIFEFPSKLDYP